MSLRITRHFADVGGRIVHFRKCGSGAPLLLVHQSPRSSLEYHRLMLDWGRHFTCIAPDTAGFGESDPLPIDAPEVEDYADATVAFLDALGLEKVAAYGFHSGAIILVTAAKRHPHRFSGMAANGYAVWTEAEKAAFAGAYLPPFVPSAYGEHLAWLWRRILEQSWVFPWYDMRPEARLSRPHADPATVHAIVMEMLASGDNYRRGYGAVLRANRDVPAGDGPTVPTFITSPDGDPLQAHIARLGPLPGNWTARPLPTLADTEQASFQHLLLHMPPAVRVPDGNGAPMGFVDVDAGGFTWQIHWRGERNAARLRIPEPGLSARSVAAAGELAIDLPGHGLSDDWPDAPTRLGPWAEAIAAAVDAVGAGRTPPIAARGLAVLLAEAAANRSGTTIIVDADRRAPPPDAADWPSRVWPDLTPDVDGSHLHRAWHWARTRRLFDPWFDVRRETAIDFDPADLAPERLAVDCLAALQARAAPALFAALLGR
jgi:pimeloyl-ACP methyl ester carboxylesterase